MIFAASIASFILRVSSWHVIQNGTNSASKYRSRHWEYEHNLRYSETRMNPVIYTISNPLFYYLCLYVVHFVTNMIKPRYGGPRRVHCAALITSCDKSKGSKLFCCGESGHTRMHK